MVALQVPSSSFRFLQQRKGAEFSGEIILTEIEEELRTITDFQV